MGNLTFKWIQCILIHPQHRKSQRNNCFSYNNFTAKNMHTFFEVNPPSCKPFFLVK